MKPVARLPVGSDVLLRGTGGALAVNIAGIGVAMLLHLLLARAMGAEAYGVYAYVLTWTVLLVLVAKMGFDTALVRYVAEYRVRRDWRRLAGVRRFSEWTALVLGTGLGVATALAVWALDPSPALTHTFAVAALLVPALALLQIRQSVLRALKWVVRSLLPFSVVQPVALAMLVGLLLVVPFAPPTDAAVVMTAHLVSVVAATMVCTTWLRRAIPSQVGGATPESHVREWLRVSAPMLLVSGMRVVGNKADILLLGLLVGTTEAGIYAVASRVSQLAALGLTAGNAIAAPVVAELYAENRLAELQRTSALMALVATAVAIVVGAVIVVGRVLLLGLFGPAFTVGATALVILTLGQALSSTLGPVGYLLNMTGRQDVNARINTATAILNVLLNLAVIPRYGLVGAAAVTAGLIVLNNAWTWLTVRRRIGVDASVLAAPGLRSAGLGR